MYYIFKLMNSWYSAFQCAKLSHSCVHWCCLQYEYCLLYGLSVYLCSSISTGVSYRCQWDISTSSISSLRFTHSKHALGGGGGIKRHGDRGEGREVFPGSLLWHCECQTPITLIRAGICMIKRIRDFNQKNSLVWKRDTLRQARPPCTSDTPVSPTPSVTASAAPVWVFHEYAWTSQEFGTTFKWTFVSAAEEEINALIIQTHIKYSWPPSDANTPQPPKHCRDVIL